MGVDLGTPGGAEVLRRLAATADVLVENFRPGTLEKWGLGPDTLHELNPGLVLVRLTGVGQESPYARRPDFGTLAGSFVQQPPLQQELQARHIHGSRWENVGMKIDDRHPSSGKSFSV